MHLGLSGQWSQRPLHMGSKPRASEVSVLVPGVEERGIGPRTQKNRDGMQAPLQAPGRETTEYKWGEGLETRGLGHKNVRLMLCYARHLEASSELI